MLFAGLLCGAAAFPQQPTKTTAPANDIFSGTVTASRADSVTVVRKVPARPDESRVFVIDSDTKIEGHLKANARVTVRFRADGDGTTHALRIIVRADTKSTSGAGRSERSGAAH